VECSQKRPSTGFGPSEVLIAAKFTLEALLEALLKEFLEGVLGSSQAPLLGGEVLPLHLLVPDAHRGVTIDEFSLTVLLNVDEGITEGATEAIRNFPTAAGRALNFQVFVFHDADHAG
jgi:hypothetical protein